VSLPLDAPVEVADDDDGLDEPETLDEVERLVCWDADSEKLVVKSHGGLKGITSPDAAEWFTAMSTDAEMVLKNARLPKELRRKPVAGT
jgi:hypothetical protein